MRHTIHNTVVISRYHTTWKPRIRNDETPIKYVVKHTQLEPHSAGEFS